MQAGYRGDGRARESWLQVVCVRGTLSANLLRRERGVLSGSWSWWEGCPAWELAENGEELYATLLCAQLISC